MCTTGALCGRREADKNQGSLWGLTTSKLKPFIQSVSEPVTSPGVAVIVVELNVKMVHEMSGFLQALHRISSEKLEPPWYMSFVIIYIVDWNASFLRF